MKRPSVLEGAGVALLASLSASILYSSVGLAAPGLWVWRLLITVLSLSYVIYLLARSGNRVGKLVAITLCVAVSGVIWWLQVPLLTQLVVQLGLVWLIRTVCFQHGVLPAMADLGLIVLGLAAAVWAWTNTASLMLSCWSFFLVQATFVLIPSNLRARLRTTQDTTTGDDPFERAYQTAEAALRRLHSTPR
jgi:hypothetical protein